MSNTRVVHCEVSLATELGLRHCPVCGRELADWYTLARIGDDWACAVCQSRLIAKLFGGIPKVSPACEDCGCKVPKGQPLCFECRAERTRSAVRCDHSLNRAERLKVVESGLQKFAEYQLTPMGISFLELEVFGLDARTITRRLGCRAGQAYLSILSRIGAVGGAVAVPYCAVAEDWTGRRHFNAPKDYVDGINSLVKSGILTKRRRGRSGAYTFDVV